MIVHPSRPSVAGDSPQFRLSVAATLPRLRLFGPPSIATTSGTLTGRAVQRHRVALLAVLATARRGARGRDQLIDMIWPDADLERGRHLLSDSVYRINRALGATVLITRGDSVELDRALLSTDVADFEAAVAQRDWPRALGLHDAPFLDGFYLPDAVDFDQWMGIERLRFEQGVERAREQVSHDRRAMAVLPFRYLSVREPLGDLADALTEEVIAAIGRRTRIPVASPLSSFALRDAPLSAVELGQRLRVAWLVEGTVRQSTELLRVTVRLTDAESGYQIWSHAVEGATGNGIAGDVAIAESIASAIGERLQRRSGSA